MKLYRTFAVLVALASLGLSACEEVPQPISAPAAATPPTSEPEVTAVPVAASIIPDLDHGQATWKSGQCMACHGPLALGGIGPALAATKLTYDEFLHTVRTAAPPMPAYDAAALPDRSVYDTYAWARAQLPLAQATPAPISPPAGQSLQPKEMMAMTIWTCRKCNTCHGVFAQGSAAGPALAGLNDPLDEELAQMRSTADTIKEHGAESIADDLFERVYQWLKKGCLENECSQ